MRMFFKIGALSALWVLLTCGVYALSAETPESSSGVEARKREYASMQKDLEAAKPGDEASKEDLVAYLELAKDSYEKFAKAHPQTAEGFESAAAIAGLLAQFHHPEALRYAELAVNSAPTAGVDVKQVAVCWVWVVQGRLEKGDSEGALAGLEKIKPLNQEIYEKVAAQVKDLVKKIDRDKEVSALLKAGNEPFPIETKDIAGKDFELAAWKGKVVIIDFWSPSSATEIPVLTELYKSNHDKGLEIVGISLDQDANELKSAVRENEIKWPVISEHKGFDGALARKWGVLSLPRMYILDRKGIIRGVNLKESELIALLDKLLSQK
jgi:peroxiredoxin